MSESHVQQPENDAFPNCPNDSLTIPVPQQAMIWGMGQNTYCMLLHLSQLGNCFFPPFGLLIPIILWVLNKDQHPIVDTHGRMAMNWLISELIYMLALGISISISIMLTYVLIGFLFLIVLIPVMIILAVIGIVFPIIAGIRANDGILWKYPFSIPFFKV